VNAQYAERQTDSAPVVARDATGQTAHGISSAQQQALMQKVVTMQEIAGATEQELPALSTAAFGQKFPVTLTGGQRISSRLSSAEISPLLPLESTSRVSVPAEIDSAEVSSADPASGAARSLERTHDLVSLHALRLRDSSADSLRVVIRPGPGLQLSLDLQLRDNGHVDVRALLNRGDYAFLNSCWPELQQQLEPRGVRLAPLHNPNPVASQDSSFAHSRRHSQEDGPELEEWSPPGMPLVGILSAPVTRPRRAARGWHTWA
jgi:hypothetical protein